MNKKHVFAMLVGALSLATGILAARFFLFESEPPNITVENLPNSNYRISGPYAYKNLALYLLHGSDTMTGKAPLTLEEAFDRKLVIVHETSDVNELEIENVSKTEEIYVQAGDIVKGGKQDRVLAVDLIVPALSGRIPLDAFCVEHGRWQQRGGESTGAFAASRDMISSKELKVASKLSKSQNEVWAKVEEQQTRLSAAANTSVKSAQSDSSLQLSLEHPMVRASADEYSEALRNIIADKTDVIGFVFAVNSEINSADLYGSSALFKKLWPRLLKASAIEAVSTYRSVGTGRKIGPEMIQGFFAGAENAPATDKRIVTQRITMITRQSKESVLLETQDARQNGLWIHRNYILK